MNATTETHKAIPSIWMLMAAYVGCAVFFCFRDSFMNGPFTFLDEAVYFQLARTIWEQFNYAGHTAYNPLYSLLIAPLFALGPETTVYACVRVLNALLWASGLFPIFWLARRWLDGFWLPLSVAAAAVLMPLSANVPLVRAEPLFFNILAQIVWLGFLKFVDGRMGGLGCGVAFSHQARRFDGGAGDRRRLAVLLVARRPPGTARAHGSCLRRRLSPARTALDDSQPNAG
jgi:hypothetical protein